MRDGTIRSHMVRWLESGDGSMGHKASLILLEGTTRDVVHRLGTVTELRAKRVVERVLCHGVSRLLGHENWEELRDHLADGRFDGSLGLLIRRDESY